MELIQDSFVQHTLRSEQFQRFCNLVQYISEDDIENLLNSLESLAGKNYSTSTSARPCAQKTEVLTQKITNREKEILVLIANGYTRRDISKALGITVHTAASHIHHIYQKLSISSVAEATQIAISEGLLQSS